VEDYAKYNTVYVELRSTPKEFKDCTKEDYINTIIEAMNEAEEENPRIRVRLILSINRQSTVEAAKELIDLAIKYKPEKYFVGVELSGNP
jgi:adenosine deaminase